MPSQTIRYDSHTFQVPVEFVKEPTYTEATQSLYENEWAREFYGLILKKLISLRSLEWEGITYSDIKGITDAFDLIYQGESEYLERIKSKVEKEFKKHSSYITSDVKKAREISDNLAEQLSAISYKSISVELTPSNAIKFKIILDDEQLITITKPFENLIDLNNNEVVYNFYINRQRIASDVKDLTELIYAINQITSQS